MPVACIHREAVEMGDLALAAETLLQLLQLQRDIGNGSVELARDEVAAVVRTQDLRQLSLPLRHELEHQQERDHAGISLGEVSEVVVAGNLAAENRALLAHAVLEEGMADAVHERHAA